MKELQGTDLLYRRWDAGPAFASPKAVFVLVHGLGAHSARWEFLAGHFAARGFASSAIELRSRCALSCQIRQGSLGVADNNIPSNGSKRRINGRPQRQH